MSFAIIRTTKIKSWGAIRNVARHHFERDTVPNADPSKPIVVIQQPSDIVATIRQKIGKQTIRKNAVLAREIFCSASPEYFRPGRVQEYGAYDPERMQKWVEATKNYLRTTYGELLVAMVVHLDEATPHIHAVLVPLDEKGKLNSRKLFSPQTLREMQTNYAASVAHLGLKRGIAGSKASHTKVAHWYGSNLAEEQRKKESQSNFFQANFGAERKEIISHGRSEHQSRRGSLQRQYGRPTTTRTKAG